MSFFLLDRRIGYQRIMCRSTRRSEVVEKCLREVWKCSDTRHQLHCLRNGFGRGSLCSRLIEAGRWEEIVRRFQSEPIDENVRENFARIESTSLQLLLLPLLGE